MSQAESALSKTLDQMLHDVTLKLSPYGGRVFVESADVDRLDHSSLELKCWFSPDLFGLSVTIGDEAHRRVKHFVDEFDEEDGKETDQEVGWRLSDIPVMLTLYKVDEAWLKESADQNDGKPVLGHFKYYPRVNTADGVVKDKRPTITAWIGLGQENFAIVRQRLLDFDKYDFDLALTITFPPDTVESRESMGKTIRWDGQELLYVKRGSIVWRKADWSSDYHRKQYLVKNTPPKGEQPYDPPREHLEVMSATSRIEAALARLSTPLWIAAGALMVLIVVNGR